MRIDILTLFPEMFDAVLNTSILKRATQKPQDRTGLSPKIKTQQEQQPPVNYHLHQLRDYTQDKHRKVDKPPFGGGPGMVIQCQPTWDAVQKIQAMHPTPAKIILLTPQGKPLKQKKLIQLANTPRILLIAGHYEGFDQRVIQKIAPEEISVGDYVLSGGELPAMILIDGIVRLLPNVLGDPQSAIQDSFSQGGTGVSGQQKQCGILDCAHYTRPAQWQGLDVPPVLLSGDHKKIDQWRQQNALDRTQAKRPDLLD